MAKQSTLRVSALTAVLLAAGLFLALAPSAAVAYDGQIKVYASAYWSGSAGEMDIDVISGIPYITFVTPSAQDFATFCMEPTAGIYPNTLYNVVLSTNIIAGAQVNPLDPETAWLFYTWNNAALTGYDYANSLGERDTDAAALQNSIWALEGYVNPLSLTGDALTWYNDALASGWTDTGPIKVMNVYDYAGADVQDLIVQTPEPGAMAASLALLTPGGVSVLLWRLRRRRNRI